MTIAKTRVPSNPDKETIAKARAVLADPAVKWAEQVRRAAWRAKWRKRLLRRVAPNSAIVRVEKKLSALAARLTKLEKKSSKKS